MCAVRRKGRRSYPRENRRQPARVRARQFEDSLWIAGESDSGELPAFLRLKEIAVGAPDVRARRGAGAAAQNVLVAHEFAIVFAERARLGAITRIRRV